MAKPISLPVEAFFLWKLWNDYTQPFHWEYYWSHILRKIYMYKKVKITTKFFFEEYVTVSGIFFLIIITDCATKKPRFDRFYASKILWEKTERLFFQQLPIWVCYSLNPTALGIFYHRHGISMSLQKMRLMYRFKTTLLKISFQNMILRPCHLNK